MNAQAARQGLAVSRRKDDRDSRTDAADAREQIANLASDLAYLRRQVHGLHAKLHGELAVLAVRMEDNERRAMQRRQLVRRWLMVAVAAAWLWSGGNAITAMFTDRFGLPVLLLAIMTMAGGIALVVLTLHYSADRQEHQDRHHNWFRLTAHDDP